METIKKFWIYFLIFIISFGIISFLTYFIMEEDYEDITNYETLTKSPVILVSECKATSTGGYIKGSVTNDTGEYLQIEYLKIDFYNENDIYLGSEYKELKYFNINETINYEINFNYNNVNKVKLQIVDEIVESSNDNDTEEKVVIADIEINPIIDDDTMKIAVPIGGLLLLHTLLPVGF